MRDPEDATCMNSEFQRKWRGTGLTMTLDPKASLKPGCNQRLGGWQGHQRSLSNPLSQGTRPGHKEKCNLPGVSDRLRLEAVTVISGARSVCLGP